MAGSKSRIALASGPGVAYVGAGAPSQRLAGLYHYRSLPISRSRVSEPPDRLP